MSAEPRLGVRSQILVAVIAVVVVGFALVYTVTMPLLEGALREDHREHAAKVSELMVGALIRAADVEAAETELDRYAGFRCVGFTDSRGALTERSAARLGPCLDPAETAALLSGADGTRWLPERGDGERLGVVRQIGGRVSTPLEVAFGPGEHARLVLIDTTSGIHKRLVAVRTLLIVFLGLALALTTLLAYAGLSRLIVAPLNRLVRAVDRLHAGDGGARAAVEGGHELAELGSSFNRLANKLAHDEKRIAQQFSELRLVNDRLEKAQENLVRSEKLASVGQLAAGVAHEIGNPMAIALGYMELMRRADTTVEERAEYNRLAIEAIHRVSGILRDLLDFSRPERDELPRADVGLAVLQCVQLLGPQPRLRHVTLETPAPDGLVHAAIGERRLVQVLVNLILNAADATVDREDAKITVWITEGTARVHVRVRDNGSGIPDSIRRQIFNPFFSTKDPGAGTGLGLPICHSIVTAEGGDIVLEKTGPEGTTFLLDLPRAD